MKKTYKEIGKKVQGELKRMGFIDYDLRRTLNNGQKAQIAKLAHQYSQLIREPQKFLVAAAPRGSKAGLKTAGFTVNKGGKAIIPLYEYDKATLKKGHVRFSREGKTEDVYLAGSRQFFQKLKEIDGKKLPRTQMVTVQIGDNNAFGARFKSYWELYQYLAKWQPKDEGEAREKIFARMSIVSITEPKAPPKPKSKKKKR